MDFKIGDDVIYFKRKGIHTRLKKVKGVVVKVFDGMIVLLIEDGTTTRVSPDNLQKIAK